MANTYTQLYVHLVFAVKSRKSLILEESEEQLYRYITGIVEGRGHKMIVINGMPDHVHILVGLNPKESISDLVKFIKVSSNKHIQDKKLSGPYKFEWQQGYGAFTYGRSQLNDIIKYIEK